MTFYQIFTITTNYLVHQERVRMRQENSDSSAHREQQQLPSKDSVPIPRYGRMINIGFRRVQLRMLASPGPISATKWCERSNPICLLNGCTMCSSWTVDRISSSVSHWSTGVKYSAGTPDFEY
ncbi:hypothetical protein T265_01296 [Opisthorchis viverrini]|uniref:Uncharacterized protein n=1 Tax=Opisthorchis viverrini TaxID=6198 RepID=A0A075A2Y7_OPIVI|nr:hypothetical protein T265_01296 [Opisthorchis viverrini]KER32607.1 hypothetical protein T265_01296 [Opisthorchis viverrini]